jgi:hypothetical protein
MSHRKIKTDNADSVGSVSDADPFAYPSNVDIFTPTNGAVTTFNRSLPVSAREPDPTRIEGLTRLRISAARISRRRGESVNVLGVPGGASVRIYGLRGDWLRTLDPGTSADRPWEWNGRDSHGAAVAAGSYHVKVSLKNGSTKAFQVQVAP